MKIPIFLRSYEIKKECGHPCKYCGTTGGIFPRYRFIVEENDDAIFYKGYFCRKCLKKRWAEGR